jgi:hypothetical protein
MPRAVPHVLARPGAKVSVAFLGGGDSLQSQAEVFSVFRERIMNMRTRIRTKPASVNRPDFRWGVCAPSLSFVPTRHFRYGLIKADWTRPRTAIIISIKAQCASIS